MQLKGKMAVTLCKLCFLYTITAFFEFSSLTNINVFYFRFGQQRRGFLWQPWRVMTTRSPPVISLQMDLWLLHLHLIELSRSGPSSDNLLTTYYFTKVLFDIEQLNTLLGTCKNLHFFIKNLSDLVNLMKRGFCSYF